MQRLVALVLLAFLIAPAVGNPTEPLEEIWFRWNAQDGEWENRANWLLNGQPAESYPRAGAHNVIIDCAGEYTIRHTEFLLAGFVFVNGTGSPTLLLDSEIGYRINDPNAVPALRVVVEGPIIGKPVRVLVVNFFAEDFSAPQLVNVTNLSSGITFGFMIPPAPGQEGLFLGELPTSCFQNENDFVRPDGVIMSVTPFDTLEFHVEASGFESTAFIAMVFTDEYQSRLGFEELTNRLFVRAVEKNMHGLQHLYDTLIWIKHHLPKYDQNDCNPDERYVYPLKRQIAPFARASDIFLRGQQNAAPGEKRFCFEVCTFCNQMEAQMGSSIGPIHVVWTGLGDDNSWSNARNWWPTRVPNFENAHVSVQVRDSTAIYLEEDTTLFSLTLGEKVEIHPGPFRIVARSVSSAAGVRLPDSVMEMEADDQLAMRKWWFGSGDARTWSGRASWSPNDPPSSMEDAMLEGFGSVTLDRDEIVNSVNYPEVDPQVIKVFSGKESYTLSSSTGQEEVFPPAPPS